MTQTAVGLNFQSVGLFAAISPSFVGPDRVIPGFFLIPAVKRAAGVESAPGRSRLDPARKVRRPSGISFPIRPPNPLGSSRQTFDGKVTSANHGSKEKPMSSTDPQTRPRGLIRRTLRKRWIPILTQWALLTVALIFAVSYLPVRAYKAVSLLRVDPKVTDLYTLGGQADTFPAYIQTQVQLLTSPNVLTAASTNPKAAVLSRVQKAGDVVQELRKVVEVSVIPNTYLIEVSMTSDNGREAATIVNAVVGAFLEASSEWSDGMTRVQIKNLEQYDVDLKNQTEELERKWKIIAAKGDLDQPARQANLIGPDHATRIDQKLIETDMDRLQAQAQLDALLAGPIKDEAKVAELRVRIDAAKRLEESLHQRRASAGLAPRHPRVDDVEIALIQDDRKTIMEMREAVIRRLEQLRYEAKGEARIRPINPNGAMVPTRPIYDRRPLLLTIIPFAVFALVFGFFTGVEAWSGSKIKPEDVVSEGETPAEA